MAQVNGGKAQLPHAMVKQFEKQQYRLVGNHSAVKICNWTKNMLRGEGSCYKHKFYGIVSYLCLQMTTSMSCANRCTFCWRDYKAPVSKEWKWTVDEPDEIIDGSIVAQKKLLEGFGGNPKVDKKVLEEAFHPVHVALSLTGEPITYPRFNELIDRFHEKGISTFVVTNGQYPETIKNLKLVTQLYLSVDAPNKDILKEIDKPLFTDFWKRMINSLKYLAEKEYRTCIRLTMIKDINMCDFKGYKKLVELGNPDFMEVKGYMFLGASRARMEKSNMPTHEEVREFASGLEKVLPGYECVSEQKESSVVLLAKKSYNKKTWINFEKFFEEAKKTKNKDGS